MYHYVIIRMMMPSCIPSRAAAAAVQPDCRGSLGKFPVGRYTVRQAPLVFFRLSICDPNRHQSFLCCVLQTVDPLVSHPGHLRTRKQGRDVPLTVIDCHVCELLAAYQLSPSLPTLVACLPVQQLVSVPY